MTHLIGLCGEYGSGKSLLAEYMKKKGFIEYAFAYPLKQIALTVGFSYNEVYGTQQDKETKNTYWGISAREFLQKFGTEICREQLPQIIPQMENVFIRCFEKKYTETKSNMVVSDVRFIDEVISIKKLGGVIIKIIREIDLKKNDEKKVIVIFYK